MFARSLSALGDRHAPLASWLTPRLDASANGFAHPSLEARSVPGAGVGVFAAAPIPEGTAVLRVPRGAFEPLSAEYAVRTARRRAPPFVAHVERVAASAGAPAFATHALFATHLCFEAFSSASADESAHQSPLRPYLASLPKLEGPEARAWGPSVPALWDDAQLETLRGTPTRAAVARRIRFVAEMHAAIFGGGASDDKAPPEVTLERFRWALATILSRATSGDALPYALLPGIDLLNHARGDGANCALVGELATKTRIKKPSIEKTDDGEEEASSGEEEAFSFAAVEVRTSRSVLAGEQLLVSYGDRADNDRLLRLYGFATEENPNDRVEVVVRVEGDALARWREKDAWGPGISLARCAVLRKHGLPRLDAFEDAAEAEAEAEATRRRAERAKGGGAAFRPPETTNPTETTDFSEGAAEKSAAAGDRAAAAADAAAFFEGLNDDEGYSGNWDEVGAENQPPESTPAAVTWRCFVSHPSAESGSEAGPMPTPMDSASPAAAARCDAATAAAAGAGGGAVSAATLLAAVRAHLLTGSEPPGPDGHEPDPRRPVSEANEAAARAVVADAANRAMRLHTHSLKVVDGDAEGAEGSESSEAAAEPPLTAEGAARIRRDLTSGEAWAESVAALRRGREKILEELLRVSR